MAEVQGSDIETEAVTATVEVEYFVPSAGCPLPCEDFITRAGECEHVGSAYLRAQLRGAVEALENIERLRAKWDAPDSGGDDAWAAVGSEAHKIASDYLGGR